MICQYKKKSFTLVEAILTTVIMAILAAVVLPHFIKEGFIKGLTMRGIVSQAASDIRYTRQLAITNSARYLIKFDFSLKKYNIYKDSISSGNQIGETKKIPEDITYSGTDQFDFYALGNCVFFGTGTFLSFGASQYKISVESPTGAVVIEKIP